MMRKYISTRKRKMPRGNGSERQTKARAVLKMWPHMTAAYQISSTVAPNTSPRGVFLAPLLALTGFSCGTMQQCENRSPDVRYT